MTTNFNLTTLNETSLDLYIEPALERHKEFSFDLSKLNFTFNATSFEDDLLTIKLNFRNPTYVSVLEVQDSLVFHVQHGFESMFWSKTLNKPLHKPYWTIRSQIKAQIPDNLATQSLESSG